MLRRAAAAAAAAALCSGSAAGRVPLAGPRAFSWPASGGAGRGQLARPVECIIFDKDGTLISFHDTWSPWADGLINRLVARCSAHVWREVKDKGFDPAKVAVLVERSEEHARKQVASTLGYDLEARRVHGESSLLAWAAQPLIREAVVKCLAERLGLGPAVAEDAIQVGTFFAGNFAVSACSVPEK
jgi:hypothetical protein